MQPMENQDGTPRALDEMSWEDMGYFFIRDKSEKPKNYSISIGNLPYKKWYVRCFPHLTQPNEIPTGTTLRLDTNGSIRAINCVGGLSNDFLDQGVRVDSDITIPGVHKGTNESFNIVSKGIAGQNSNLPYPVIRSEFQSILSGAGKALNLGLFVGDVSKSGDVVTTGKSRGTGGDNSQERRFINRTLRENYDKRVASSDSGAPMKLLTVSEVTYPGVVGADTTYKGMCVVGAKIRTSDRMTSSPDLSLFINEGRVIRNHISAGIHQGSDGNTLLNLDESFNIPELVPSVTFAYNLDTGVIDQISSIENANEVNTPGVYWNTGDRYVLFNVESSNYFPDIYVDFLINPDGGLGGLIDAEEFIDYESIVEANRFVKENNFFFDGVVDAEKEFAAWATEEGALSRLIPAKIDGKFGLVVETPDIPVEAIFNESNIIKDTYEEEYVPWQDNAVNQVVLTYTNGSDLQRPVTAVTARTPSLNSGAEKLVTYNIDAHSISDTAQAVNIAATILNTKRIQNKAVKFSTALQGLYLRPGSRIIVQHQINEFDFETSGYVTALKSFDDFNKTQSFLLSRNFVAPAEVANYRATVQLQVNGQVYENLSFTIVQEDGRQYMRFADQSIPSTLSVGDPIMISRVSTENRDYRIQNISRDEESKISITAINWTEDMFNYDDVEIIIE